MPRKGIKGSRLNWGAGEKAARSFQRRTLGKAKTGSTQRSRNATARSLVGKLKGRFKSRRALGREHTRLKKSSRGSKVGRGTQMRIRVIEKLLGRTGNKRIRFKR